MPSSEPRIRRSGQVPSWTPATTTRSHSSPLDRCAVRTATASPCGLRSASVSPAISWPARLSRKSRGEPGGSRAPNRLAASNSAAVASRSASAAAPRLPPAALAACQAPARPEALHTAQSTSCAVPPSAAVCLASAIRSATRRAAAIGDEAAGPAVRRLASPAAGPVPPWPASASWLAGQPASVSSRGSRSAAASGSSAGGSPADSAAARSARRSRRRPRASVPPSGPVSSSAAVSSSSAPGCRAQFSRVSSGFVPGSAASGSSSPATVTGTPAAARARCSKGTCRAADRTSTAIDDQLTPSIRCARRSVSAITAASWVALAAIITRTVPGSVPGPAASSRCPVSAFGAWVPSAPGSLRATRRDAASRTGPLRRLVRSAITCAGRPSGARKRSAKRMIARVSAPRKP